MSGVDIAVFLIASAVVLGTGIFCRIRFNKTLDLRYGLAAQWLICGSLVPALVVFVKLVETAPKC